MPKLNQILAIEKGTKDRCQGVLTDAYQQLQKGDLLNGLSRSYEKLNEDGEQFPPEDKRVQIRASEAVANVSSQLEELFNVTAAKDYANTEARADVVVEDDTGASVTLLSSVPATYLLWIEKRLVDLHTLVTKLPSLSPEEDWAFDDRANCYRSKEHKTAKTKKIPRPFVKYEATKEHPAQVDIVADDVVTGYWTTIKYSGALPAQRIATLKTRVERLQAAVKFAREQANLQEAPKQDIGGKVLGFLFA